MCEGIFLSNYKHFSCQSSGLLLKPDVPDNFKKNRTKTIPMSIILSKSKYDLKTRY